MMGMVHALRQPAPGPQGLELIRYIRGFFSDPLTLFADLGKRYGDVARLELGPYLMHVLSAPAHFERVLVNRIDIYPKSLAYGQTRPVLGAGLANNSGPNWRARRSLLAAALAPIHPLLTAVVNRATQDVAAVWGMASAEAPPFNLWQGLMDLHFEIMVQVLFGVKSAGDTASFRQGLTAARDIMDHRLNAIWSPPDWAPTAENRSLRRAVKAMDEFLMANILSLRSESGAECVLQTLVQLGAQDEHQLSDRDLRDEIASLMFAGIEDPVNVLAWALYLLARSPRSLQQALQAEVDSVLGERLPAAADLTRMTLMRRLLNEAMRLYPPGWGFLRDVSEEDTIDGYTIPAGSMVFLPAYLLHRRPDIWSTGGAFAPGNFSEPLSTRQLQAYLPFGAGERSCVGEDFGRFETQLILAFLLSRFDLQLTGDTDVAPAALQSLRPRSRLPLVLRRRKTG